MKETLVNIVNKLNDKYIALGVLLSIRAGDVLSTGLGASMYGASPEQNDFARSFLEDSGPWFGNITHEIVVWGPMLLSVYVTSKLLGKYLDLSSRSIEIVFYYSLSVPGFYIVPNNFYNIYF